MIVIRQAQMDAFSTALIADFRENLSGHVARLYPGHFAVLGKTRTLGIIDKAIVRCRSYGMEGRRDIARYLDVMLVFGEDFDISPRWPWAGLILRNQDSSGEVKSARLVAAATSILDGIVATGRLPKE